MTFYGKIRIIIGGYLNGKEKRSLQGKPLNENKKNIIASLIEEYDIETADDIQEALKDLLGGTIKSMMESEMDEHLGYESYERSDSDNYRNGTKSKKCALAMGNLKLMSHRTEAVPLNLKPHKSARRIFLGSTRKS